MARRSIRARTIQVAFACGLGALFFGGLSAFGAVGPGLNAPAASPAQNGKQAVCHRTRSAKKPRRTIMVSQSAVAAHMAHGDTMGACPTSTTTTVTAPTTTGATTTSGNRGNGNGKK